MPSKQQKYSVPQQQPLEKLDTLPSHASSEPHKKSLHRVMRTGETARVLSVCSEPITVTFVGHDCHAKTVLQTLMHICTVLS